MNKTTEVIILCGIAGSGKSYLATRLASVIDGCFILSKDDLRYVEGNYVFNDSTEPDIERKYFCLLELYLVSKKYDTIILDNTHINLSFVQKTIDLLKKYNASYVSIILLPSNELKVHQERNTHSISFDRLKTQRNDWLNNQDKFKNIVGRYVPIDQKGLLFH